MENIWTEVKTVTGTLLPWGAVVLVASLYVAQQERFVSTSVSALENQLAEQAHILRGIEQQLAQGVAIPPLLERGRTRD